ncbi:MAG TPA: hypothetical protein VF458_02825 [Ktedonobacteraceae bacterium]
MSVLESERRSATRSALRYRPIEVNSSGPGPLVARQRRSRPDTLTITTPVPPDELDLEEESHPPRRRSAARPVAPRKSTPPTRVRRHFHPLFFVGLGLIATILLWTGVTQLLAWGANTYNNIVYGYPRTFQIDQVVGHQDSISSPSHFLALNFHGRVEVIELPGGDATRARIFLGPQLLGTNSDLDPVTLRFVDLTGNGKLDMVIEVQGSQIVFLNDQGTFRPLRPDEQNQIMQRLHQLKQ